MLSVKRYLWEPALFSVCWGMIPMSYLLVGLGGALGAMGRYWITYMATRLDLSGFPYATLLVNIVGSFAIGLVIGYLSRTTPDWSQSLRLLLATGFCGGFTTFSAFSLDAVILYQRGELSAAAVYVVLSTVLSISALVAALGVSRGIV